MAKKGKGINYRQASAGSTRGISAGQWNGFLQVHKDFYAGLAGNAPLPPVLQGSTIATAILADDADDIPAFTPVRIVKQINYTDIIHTAPSYVVEPVDEEDGEKHGNYGFTVHEGVTENNGGRIVVAGIALVMVEAQDIYYNKLEEARTGLYDASFYMVPDNTLSEDLEVIGPVGHFKIVGWPDLEVVGGFEADKLLLVAIDMDQRATIFSADLGTAIPAPTDDDETGITTFSSSEATVFFGKEDSEAEDTQYEVQKNEEAYKVRVFNHTSYDVDKGKISVIYSQEYNRFLAIGPKAEEDTDDPCDEVSLTWYESDVRCIAGVSEGGGELHQYKRQNQYALVCVLDEATGITKCCPEVLQGAWFYDRRIACEVNCCEGGDPPEYCVNCDECVDVYIQGVGIRRFKKTGTTGSAGVLYIPCGDGCCFWYMTDEEFVAGGMSLSTCWEDNGNTNGDGDALSYNYAIWSVTLYCQAGDDHADQDTYTLSAERKCVYTSEVDGVAIGYRPPCNEAVSGTGLTSESASGTAEKLCSEESSTGQMVNPFNTFSRDFTVTKVDDDDCPTDCGWTSSDCAIHNSGGSGGGAGAGGGAGGG